MTSSAKYSVGSALIFLRSTSIRLHHSGANGFEGLLATVLSHALGLPVRLAGGGAQFGQDALVHSPDVIISLEAKRYDGPIPKNEVLGKLAEINTIAAPPDLWILGATVEVKSQIVEPLATFAKDTGTAVEILDWPTSSEAPPLAAFLLLAPDRARQFLCEKLNDTSLEAKLKAIFALLSQDALLCSARAAILERLSGPTIGLELARRANAAWLTQCFTSSPRATAEFGQKLCPLEPRAFPLQVRPELEAKILSAVFSTEPGLPIFIVGGQGHGKSWAVANAWLKAPAPLTIVITANEAAQLIDTSTWEDALCRLFIRQTGERFPGHVMERWQRRFERWRNNPSVERPRFVLWIDGVNQRADMDWQRVLHRLSNFSKERGGQVAVTIRPALYRYQQHNLPEHDRPIEVEAWNDAELNSILAAEKIERDTLNPNVVETLHSPRLCAIAFKLRKQGSVSDFTELTVSRLLFEQIRSAESGSPHPDEFIKSLELHAAEILRRAHSQEDTPAEFQASQEIFGKLLDRLHLLAEDGFYVPLPEDQTAYMLLPSGMSLGLAIGVLRQMQRAFRMGDDPDEAYANALETIEAVDEASDIVLDALQIAAIDTTYAAPVFESLIAGYIRLQNVGSTNYAAFASTARARSDAFLKTLEKQSSGSRSAFNHDWLLAAIVELAADPASHGLLRQRIESWLSRYSLEPSISIMTSSSSPTEIEIEERRGKISERLSGLSAAENRILKTDMIEDPDIRNYALIEDGLVILRKLDLAPSIEAMGRYVLGMHINAPKYHMPTNLEDLVRYNRRDWPDTRAAILTLVEMLEVANPSDVGKWTTYTLLSSTGHPDDAARASDVQETLISEERNKFRAAWSQRVKPEPADSREEPPAELLAAAIERLSHVDPKKWRVSRNQTPEDINVRDDMPLLARWAPGHALTIQRRLIDDTLSRSGDRLQFALFDLIDDASALTEDQQRAMIQISLKAAASVKGKEKRDGWINVQYAMLLGIRSEDADTQMDYLAKMPGDLPLLLEFDNVIGAPDAKRLEEALVSAIADDAMNRIVMLLRFADRAAPELTKHTLALCEQLSQHDNSVVRAYALAVFLNLEPGDAQECFARSSWQAGSLDANSAHFERWYGSLVLIEACKAGHLSVEDLIKRIIVDTYSVAIDRLGSSTAEFIIDRIDAAVRIRLESDIPSEPPVIYRDLSSGDIRAPYFISLEDRPSPEKNQDPFETLKQINEAESQFQERYERRKNAYSDFCATMTAQGAEALLTDVGWPAIQACYALSPQQVVEWAGLIEQTRLWNRRALKNLGLHIVRAICTEHANTARSLLAALSEIDAFVTLRTGHSKLRYETLVHWQSAHEECMIGTCFSRLDLCTNDAEVAEEVLAALHAGRQDLIDRYIGTRSRSVHPMDKARAVCVSGLALGDDRLISEYESHAGALGEAARFARKAWERNHWARHWWHEMQIASTTEDYWRYSVLLRTCTDSRFDIWAQQAQPGNIASIYNGSIINAVDRSIRDSLKSYKKTCQGRKPPTAWFITGAFPDESS